MTRMLRIQAALIGENLLHPRHPCSIVFVTTPKLTHACTHT